MRRPPILMMLLLALTTAALAQPRPPAGRPGPGGPFGPPPGGDDRLAEYLGLNESQKAAWTAAHAELRTATEPLAARQRDLDRQLHTALESGSSDACALGNVMLQIRSTGDQLHAAHEALDAKLESVLTAEQKARYQSFRAALAAMRPGPPRE